MPCSNAVKLSKANAAHTRESKTPAVEIHHIRTQIISPATQLANTTPANRSGSTPIACACQPSQSSTDNIIRASKPVTRGATRLIASTYKAMSMASAGNKGNRYRLERWLGNRKTIHQTAIQSSNALVSKLRLGSAARPLCRQATPSKASTHGNNKPVFSIGAAR
ncbi:MAG: hypothetical protein EBT07_14740 [Actinobacteria bacterium]|nr:hypothetical protein [Actinomycetota bacterium]